MKSSFKLTFVALLMAAFSLTVVAYENWDNDKYLKDEYQATVDLSGITKVDVETSNGYIIGKVHSGNDAVINVYAKARENDRYSQKELLDTIKMKYEKSGSTLKIFFDRGKFDDNWKALRYFSGSFELKLPASIDIHFSSSNGKIEAGAFQGNVDLDTSNGSITCDGTGGRANLDTSNGRITLKNATGPVDASTSNGSISIVGGGGPIKAESSNGKIEIELTDDIKGDIHAETSNGSIYLEAKGYKNYTLRADTTNGKVYGSSELDYNKRRNFAQGTFGTGQYKITLETSNGSIKIK